MDRTRHGRTQQSRDTAGEAGIANPRARQRAMAIAVLPQPPADREDPLAELKELLRTAGVATAGEAIQVRPG